MKHIKKIVICVGLTLALIAALVPQFAEAKAAEDPNWQVGDVVVIDDLEIPALAS